MSMLLMMFIRFYQKGISPFLRPRCRYSPTCSQYSYEAIKTHGAFFGFVLTIFRVLRCNPFSSGGYDPVPPKDFYKLGLW